MAETITITITPEGETEIAVKGVKGKGCQSLTAAIEKALGTVETDTPTREMHERPEANRERNTDRA